VSESVYLDYAATAPMRREVLEEMFPFFQDGFGNPSSVHGVGARASAALETARGQIADVLGCLPEELVFTSGGTESDNLALAGVVENRERGGHTIISAIEHEAVLNTASSMVTRGHSVSVAPVDSFGSVHATSLAELVRSDTVLVSCMLANNEIGTIEPVAEISAAVRAVNPNVLVHTDAVQAAGALGLDVRELSVDMLSLSAHKIGGPRGVGAVYIRRGIELAPIIHGGGQEGGRRSGTENVAGAVGLATALVLAQGERAEENARLSRLRDRLIAGVLDCSPNIRLTGHPTNRLPGHASFVLADRSAESVLVDLDVLGIQCSSGSACHAGQTDPSHVLLAIGLDGILAKNGLRMTLGHRTNDEDIDRALAAVARTLGAAREPVPA